MLERIEAKRRVECVFRGRRSIRWAIAGARNAVFFTTKSSPRSNREGLRSGGCEMTVLCWDCVRIILESSFYRRRQAQYLVSFKGDFTGSAHWK